MSEKSKKFLGIGKENKIPFHKKLISALIVNFGLVFSVFLFIPFEVFFGNINEFIFGLPAFAKTLLLVNATIFLAATIFELLFNGKLFWLIQSMVFGVTLASYVQGMFLNGMMSSLDGSTSNWTFSQKIINLGIWFIIFLIPVIICIFWEKISNSINKFFSLAIAAVQVVALISMFITIEPPTLEQLPSCDGLYDVSGKKNVIVFVLDRFDTENVQKILEEDPNSLNDFRGFTYYPNMVGSYVYTQNTVPYLITGVSNPDLYITSEQKATNIENSEYLKIIDEKTDSLCIYSEPKFLETSASNINELVDNVKPLQLSLNFIKLAKASIKSSLYRVAPFCFKARFNYTSGNFNAATYSGLENTIYACESHEHDADFMRIISEKGLTVNKSYGDSAFKFIHFQGAHFPYHLTADAKYSEFETDLITTSKGSLKIVAKYFEELEKLGLYKDATIIVTSDHGETILIKDLNTFEDPSVNPIMFYKPAGVGYDEDFYISDAPICHADIFPTIISALGGDSSQFGTTIEQFEPTTQRVREFYWSVQDPEVDGEYYIPHKFVVEGDSRDPNSWKYIGR